MIQFFIITVLTHHR